VRSVRDRWVQSPCWIRLRSIGSKARGGTGDKDQGCLQDVLYPILYRSDLLIKGGLYRYASNQRRGPQGWALTWRWYMKGKTSSAMAPLSQKTPLMLSLNGQSWL
jgi:hypothetical protein